MISQVEVDEATTLAWRLCGTCKDYHLTRPLLIASGVRRGPERDQEMFAPLLRRVAPRSARVLIAGAADAGLMNFVLDALPGDTPNLTVVDLCPTPLQVCELAAKRRSVSISSRVADLAKVEPFGRFDLIVAHLILRRIPEDQKSEFLNRMRLMLAPGGHLIAAFRPGKRVGPRMTPGFDEVMQKLTAAGLSVPQPRQDILEALRRVCLESGDEGDKDTDAVEADFQNAGLSIVERHELRPGDQSGRFPRVYVVAAASGEPKQAGAVP